MNNPTPTPITNEDSTAHLVEAVQIRIATQRLKLAGKLKRT
jgi:hypothetical protein